MAFLLPIKKERNRVKRLEYSMLIGLIFSVLMGSTAAFGAQCDTVRQDVVRLHILANSDSQEDQALKLQVRDAVLAEAAHLFQPAGDQAEACRQLEEELPALEALARRTLQAAGCEDEVEAQVVNMYFSTRSYDGFDLPAGRYDALRINIGEGAGHNWWCVVYPPLCVTAAQPESETTQQARQEVLALGQTPVYKPKLAVVELWENLREKTTPPEPENPEEAQSLFNRWEID